MKSPAPLAFRLRPKTLEEFFGQSEVIGEGTQLRKAIKEDTLSSVILAGPTGTGKTTLAHIIAEKTKLPFVQLSAVTSGVKDIKGVCAPRPFGSAPIDSAQGRQGRLARGDTKERNSEGDVQLFPLPRSGGGVRGEGRKILFIDEIHRFNKAQQDAVLPYVESGRIILIGATTENPYFSVNSAIISRSQVFLLKPLSVEDLVLILKRALKHADGYAEKVNMSDDAVTYIAKMGNGDGRIALNLLEVAVLSIGYQISLEQAKKMLATKSQRYDKSGEDHYDTISAFIKTMRGSDVDAALIWLYKMIESGEDPRFLFRRMAIFASEDVGNADPRALQLVISAWQAYEMVGLPEGEFFLAHACVYLSQAPKSNAITEAMSGARKIVKTAPTLEVPYHIRNAPVEAMKKHGYHEGYQYAHTGEGAIVAENYFPIGLQPVNLYRPSERGFEAEVKVRWEKSKKIVRAK